MNDSDRYRTGVGMMLLNARGHVLICRRLDVEGGAWQMPQGGVLEGEHPKRAAFRELKEEIGTDDVIFLAESKTWQHYDLPAPLIGKAWGGRYIGQRLKWCLLRFVGRDDDINVETHQPEFDGWLWVPADHLPDLVVSFKREMYEAVIREFRPMIGPGG